MPNDYALMFGRGIFFVGWFGFVVWLAGGGVNLEDVPSSPSASHPITGLQQIVGLDGACWAPWVGDQTLTSFCPCSLMSASC